MQDVFPNMPAEVILADLRITHSVEITIENIIEERVTASPVSIYEMILNSISYQCIPYHKSWTTC